LEREQAQSRDEDAGERIGKVGLSKGKGGKDGLKENREKEAQEERGEEERYEEGGL